MGQWGEFMVRLGGATKRKKVRNCAATDESDDRMRANSPGTGWNIADDFQ